MPIDPKRELLLAEGIETGLSAAQLLELPCWAAVSAVGLKTLELPLAAQRLCIAADHDDAGKRAAAVARTRAIDLGREVRIILPRTPGYDFNDVLTTGNDEFGTRQ
jgi:putative DNA primase/helicase